MAATEIIHQLVARFSENREVKCFGVESEYHDNIFAEFFLVEVDS
jgi:hypothetical protein